jgi:two-component system, NarL family, response regulator DevR
VNVADGRCTRRSYAVTRVYLVEDSPILGKLLVGLLEAEKDVSVVGRADAAATATEEIVSLAPDVAIIDLHLRVGTGLDVLRAVARAGVSTICIVLSNHASAPYRKAALDAGAHYFFDKSTEIPLMLAQVRAVAKRSGPRA